MRGRIKLVFDDFEAQWKSREGLCTLVVSSISLPSTARVASVGSRCRRLAMIHGQKGPHILNLLQFLLSLLNLLVEVGDPARDVKFGAFHLSSFYLHVVYPVGGRIKDQQ